MTSVPWWQHACAATILVVLGGAIYYNTLEVPFYFDDHANIVNNPNIRVTELDLSKFYTATFEGRVERGNQRPLAYLTFAINYYLGEKNVRGYHIANILIHVTAGILCYFLAVFTFELWDAGRHREQLRNAGTDPPSDGAKAKGGSLTAAPIFLMSLFAACLFVAHPIQTQSVTYIVQRMTSMSTMLFFAALLLYLAGRTSTASKTRILFWVAAFLTWILALGSKQIAATLPAIILLYECFFFRDLDPAWMKKAAVRFLLPALAVLGILILIYTNGDPLARIEAGYSKRDFTLGQRLATQPRVLILYMSLIAFPAPTRLSLLHSIETSRHLFDPITSFLSLLAIVGLLVVAIWMARRQRMLSFAVLWFFINLVLESSVLALEMVYEHRLYLPMFGVVMGASYLLFVGTTQMFGATRTRNWLPIAAVLIIGFCAVGTVRRNKAWQAKLPFWAQLASQVPASAQETRVPNRHASRIRNNYGVMLTRAEKFREAYEQYLMSRELDPTYPEAHFNIGITMMRRLKQAEAIDAFTEAIKFQPKYSTAYFHLGRIRAADRQYNEAIKDFTSAVEIYDDFHPAFTERSKAYRKLKEFDLAIADLTRVIELDPKDPARYRERSACYAEMGEFGLSRQDHETAERLQAEKDRRR